MLAGGTATLPGLKDRVTELTGFASMVVNPFENMKLGSARAREQAAPRSAVVSHRLRPGDAEVRAVILINLLPHREERRKRTKIAFFAGARRRGGRRAGRSSAVWYLVVQQLISGQQERNAVPAGRDHASSTSQIKDIASLKAEIASLKARQKAVEDLQIDRNVPVHLLNELVKQVPEGIYITLVKQDGQTLTVAGIAQTQERVSELLRNTAYNSEWLVQAGAGREQGGDASRRANKEQKRLFDFAIRLTVKRPQDAPAAAVAGGRVAIPAAASAPAPAAPRRARRPEPPWQPRRKTANVDLNSVFEGAAVAVPRPEPERARPVAAAAEGADLCVAVASPMVVAGWFVVLLERARRARRRAATRNRRCKADYRNKLAQAVNLGELRKQKLQVEEYVTQLEKQLPGKAEMDALLSDINQAGLGRGLQFELFRPGPGRDQGLLRRAADRDQGDRPLPRHRLVRRRHRQPVAHRHPAQHGHHAPRKDAVRRAGDGSDGAHLPLSRSERDRGDQEDGAAPRRRPGAKK